MEIQRLREGMEKAKLKSEKVNMEVDMTEMALDINEAPKGEDPLGPSGCDHKEEKEPAPMAVEWGGAGAGRYPPPYQRGRE